MSNKTESTATAGDVALYARFKDGNVSAVHGNSSVGFGWRPTCKGSFLGNKCYDTEAQAITGGKGFIEILKNRVTNDPKPASPKVKRSRASAAKRT